MPVRHLASTLLSPSGLFLFNCSWFYVTMQGWSFCFIYHFHGTREILNCLLTFSFHTCQEHLKRQTMSGRLDLWSGFDAPSEPFHILCSSGRCTDVCGVSFLTQFYQAEQTKIALKTKVLGYFFYFTFSVIVDFVSRMSFENHKGKTHKQRVRVKALRIAVSLCYFKSFFVV